MKPQGMLLVLFNITNFQSVQNVKNALPWLLCNASRHEFCYVKLESLEWKKKRNFSIAETGICRHIRILFQGEEQIDAVNFNISSQLSTQLRIIVSCMSFLAIQTVYADDIHSGNDILSFEVPGQVGNSIIDKINHTITFHADYHTMNLGLPKVEVSEGALLSSPSGEPQFLAAF